MSLMSTTHVFVFQCLRYLTLSTTFNQLELEVSSRYITFMSNAYVQAINGATFGGNLACYLSSGSQVEINTPYNVLTDFHNCSTANGGLSISALSTTVGRSRLYYYYGYNGPCSTLYGPLVAPATETSSLVRDAASVGGAVYGRLGEPGCQLGTECPAISLTAGACDSQVEDNAEVVVALYDILVTDRDGLTNTDLTYSITGGTLRDNFELNPSTGILTLVRSLDRETSQSFTLQGSVGDGLFSGNFSIRVEVLDVNDNGPVPVNRTFVASVLEGLPNDTLVTTAEFRDADDGDNARLTYSIASSNFAILDLNIPNIYTNRVFDYEDGDRSFLFVITAEDSGSMPLIGQANVSITVVDVNDNRPTLQLSPGGPYVEDSAPVIPATVMVSDVDSDAYPILFAAATITNPINGDFETLSLDASILPSGFKFGFFNGTVFVIGSATPNSYSLLLSSISYENTAPTFGLPLERTILYGVCDMLASSLDPSSLSVDTQLALRAMAAISVLPAQDARILERGCSVLVSMAVDISLVETNDRPVVMSDVTFPDQPEDFPTEENRGSYVISLFESAVTDTDRNSAIGIAVVDSYTGAATPQRGTVRSNQQCLAIYGQISAIENGCSGNQLNNTNFCECSYPRLLSCITSPSAVIFTCLDGSDVRTCTCPLPQQSTQPTLPEFSEISSLSLYFGSGNPFNLVPASPILELGRTLDFTIEKLEELFNFTMSLTTLDVTLQDGTSFVRETPPSEVEFEDFGPVGEEAALLLGPLDFIRWVSIPNTNGNASFSFKGWDTTNGLGAGTREVNTSASEDTSFSLDIGLATIMITPVNDPPVILLNGAEANYSTEYTEGIAVHVTSNPMVLDNDNLMLANLTVRIYPVGGGCNVLGYSGPSNDVLIHAASSSLALTVSVVRVGQACVNYYFVGSMSVSNWQSFIMSLRFNATENEPSDHTRVVEFVIDDAISSSVPAFTTVSLTLVSDTCPVLALDSSSPVTYRENGPPVTVSPLLNLTDGDRNSVISSATAQILQTPNVMCSGCTLNISSTSQPSQVQVSYDQTSMSLTFDGTATPAEYQRLLRDVVFLDEGEEPTFSLVTVRFTVQDPVLRSCQGVVADVGVMIEHVNDVSPELYLNYPISQDFNQTFIEGVGSVSASAAVFILDRDGLDSPTYRVKVTISNECYASEDRLEFSSVLASSLLSEYNITTCSLELEGNLTNLVEDLSTLRYLNLDVDNPTASTRSIEFVISDEALPPTTSTTLLSVVSVNDAPNIDLNVSDPFSPNITRQLEDSSVTITSNGVVSDPEGDILDQMTFTLTEVDSMGNEVTRSDALYEELEVPSTILDMFNLSGTFFASSGQLIITGSATGAAYTEVLNNCFYRNRRFPVTDDNARLVTVTARDSLLSNAAVASTIVFRVSRNAPMLDLDSTSVGINAMAEYRSTNPPLTLFPNAVLIDMDLDNICRLELTLSGSTCPALQIEFSNAYPDISLNTISTSSAVEYVLTTRFIDCRQAIVFQDVVKGITVSDINPESSGTCSFTAVAVDDQGTRSVPAMATITVRAFNVPPFIDLDLGLGGRDFSTIYFQGGNLQHIVSIFDPATAHNITDVTVVGEAMDAGEAPGLGAPEIGSYDDGTIYHGVVIMEKSYAGYVVRDTDSPTLGYVQVEFFSGAHLEQDAIVYPCVTTVPLPPYGCNSSDSSPTTFLTPTCNSSVFDSCHIQDLCMDLQVTIFCPSPGRKAYRFEYLRNAFVSRYEVLLGLLGYDFLPRTGGQITQMRLLNITVFDPLSGAINPLAITRIRIRSQENLIIVTDPPNFVVYEDERPRRTCNLYQITVRRLDGTTPSPSEIIYNISQGNIGDAFGVTDEGVIFLNNRVDREAIATYNLTITTRLRIADPDTTSSAFLIANVIDVNDNPPVTQDFYNVNVTEMMVNETVVQLNVTDRDEGVNAEFNYFVLGIGESNFAVDQNGRIYTTTPLDRSAEDYYLLVVVIYDRGMIPLATHTVVNVMVVTPPPTQIEFRSSSVYNVPENTQNGTTLLNPLAAFEVGTDETEFIQYRFNAIFSDQSGNMERPFEVNEETGIITVVGSLDSEATSSYTAYAEAFSTRTLFPPGSGFLNITFNILDENETPPMFNNIIYELNVDENTPISTTLITFTATDNDVDNQALTFSLSPNTPLPFPFRVDPSGGLVVNDTIDYESSQFYNFEVIVTDSPPHGMTPQQGTATVIITVRDLNDNPPLFLDTPYNSSVLETAPNGTIVIEIESRDIDSFINNAVTYTAMGLNGTPFCLYENHDFIEVCDSDLLTSIEQEDVVYEVTIVATNPPGPGSQDTQISTTAARISVVLVNEYPPEVRPPVANINITEEHCGRGRGNTCNGIFVFDVSTITSDLDGGRGGELNYRLRTTSVPFTIDLQSGIITVNGSIDREQIDMYSLSIEVTDGGDSNNMVRSATSTVNIIVEDIDDNAPVIVEPCVFDVPENVTETAIVFGQVNISDPDLVGTHLFSVLTFTDPPVSQGCILISGLDYLPIQLDPTSGNLSFCLPVDFEMGPNSYSFRVRVLDRGPYSATESSEFAVIKTITVNILDSNDNPPIFPPQNLNFSISENQPIGTSVGSVTAEDSDGGDNSLLQFYVVGGSNSSYCNNDLPFYTVKTSATTADILQCQELDYESQQLFIFQVQVEDNGPVPLSDSTNVSVNVLDRNDNSPIFSEPVYYMTIFETDFLLNTVPVVTVSVSDADSPPNSITTFRIISPTNSPFGLRNAIGNSVEVFVAAPERIDFESGITGYDVVVEATNAAPEDETQMALALVNVTIRDINDNAPVIQPPFDLTVRENQPLGTPVGTVIARDADTEAGGRLNFYIGSNTADQSCSSGSTFIINTTSGQISTCQPLDYESQAVYSVLVVVCDRTIPPMCSNITLTVNVVDLNDNFPVFTEDPFIVDVDENTARGTLIGTISSADADTSANSNVTYSLPNTNLPFSVIGNEVYFTGDSSQLDYEQGNRTYIINIQARNPPAFQDDVTLITDVAFVINLIDRNDNPPVFPGAVDTTTIEEHAPVGEIVFSINSTDADSLANSGVTYSIVETGTPFAIDGSNVVVQNSVSIDYDPPSNIRSYTLIIRATNPPAAPNDQTQTSDFTLVVNVNDINDNTPVCIGRTSFMLREDVLTNVDLVEITARDIDSGLNGNILYFPPEMGMADPTCSDDNIFSIDPDSGAILICQPFDYETRMSYATNFTICDMGTPRLCSTCPVTVIVTDVNDNAPVILLPTMFSVSELEPVNYIIGCADATDADSLQNAELEYHFGSGVDDCSFNTPFNINDTSGCISVCLTLDYETRQNYTFPVNVSDRGSPPLFNVTTFTIVIENENDHSPVITSLDIANVTENDDDALVIRVTSQDLDLPPYNIPTYSLLVNDGGRFTINSVTGTITTTVPLDREEQDQREIVVAVSDGLNTVNQTITVTVLDENDNPPEYIGSLNFTYMENFLFSIVLMFRDNDTGENARLIYSVDDTDFEVDSNGVLRNIRELDRDGGTPQVVVSVTARDATSMPLSTTVSLTITLLDVNDNDPILDPIRGDIIDGTRAGTVVGIANATDADEGTNAALKYFLGTPSDTFEVDENTGEIRLIRNIFITSATSEVLLVTINVSDAGTPVRSDSVQGVFSVVSSFPLFNPNIYSFSIEENMFGDIIGNVSAMDRDVNPFNDFFLFTIISVRPYDPGFSIESMNSSGALLSPLTYLDYEDARMFYLTVGVGRFNTSGVVDDTADITLTITEVNDNVPRLSPVNVSAEVLENSVRGTTVAKLVAIDFDAGESGIITYNISGTGADIFSINSDGDLVISQANLDFEQVSLYNLAYQACDNGTNQKCSEVGFIFINVVDVDDIPPVFSPTDYTIEIPENFGSQRLVLYINITDGDTSLEDLDISLRPPQSSFQVMVGGPNVLAVSTTLTPLDREEQALYTFEVVARDPSGSEVFASVTIQVADVNDEPPRVVPSSSVVQFQEGGPPVYLARQLDIVDGDTAALFPLTRTSVSLQSDPGSNSSYPNDGGMCDHANYSILYQNNVHSLCGQENCLYLLQQDELITFGSGTTLANGILTLPAGTNFARNSAIFVGERFQNFTITVWVKFPGRPTAGNIYEVQSGNVNVFELHIDTDGSFGIRIRTSLTTFRELLRSPSVATQDGEWHQISFTRNGSHLILYLDCEVVASTVDSNEITTDFSSGSLFVGLSLENVEISELYFCSSVVLSRSDICCSLTCGEYVEVAEPTPDVGVTVNRRKRSLELVYTGTDPASSLSALVNALRNVTYLNVLDEPHPLDRGLLVMAYDQVGSGFPAVVSLRPILLNDKRPALDLNGTINPGIDYFTSSNESSPTSLIVGPDALLYDTDSGLFPLESILIVLEQQRSHRLIIPSELPPGLAVTFSNEQRDLFLEAFNNSHPVYPDTFLDVLRQVQYSNLLEEQNQFDVSVLFRVTDVVDLSSSPLARTYITVLPINDPPLLDLTAGSRNSSVVFQESLGVVNLLSGVMIEDSDSTMLREATVSFTFRPDGLEETLQLQPGSSPSVDPNSVDFNPTLGALTISHTATLNEWRSILQNVQYLNSNQNPSLQSTRQVVFVVQDDGGAYSNSAYLDIQIVLHNNPPELFLGGPGVQSYTASFVEDGPCVSLVSNDAVIRDPDSTGILFLQVMLPTSSTDAESIMYNGSNSMINPFSLSRRNLAFSAPPDSTEIFTEFLRDLVYCNTADEPDSTTRTISYSIFDNGLSDGQGVGSSIATSTVDIVRVNDQPSVTFSQLDDVSIRDIPIAIINSSSIVIDDSDDLLFDMLNIIITNPQDGSDDELIQFAAQLPGSSISRGPLPLSDNQILYTVTFTGGADVNRVTETISQVRYNNRATNLTPDPPRVICVQLRDFKIFSELSCVNVTISPPNSHDPEFVGSTIRQFTFSEVSNSTIIGIFEATDSDTGREGTVEYRIESVVSTGPTGTGFTTDIFTVNPSSGELVAPNGFDAEIYTSHTITLLALDQGNPVRTDSIIITVTVTDVNDEAPVFDGAPYVAPNLREDLEPPNNIIQVQAMDGDSSAANRQNIHYALNNLQDRFVIDNLTGVIQSVVTFDAEEQQVYVLNVSASDSGNPPLVTYTTVTLTLIDTNDNTALVDQQAPAVYVTNRGSSSIGPAVRIIDQDLSPSAITFVRVSFMASAVDSARTYDQCLVRCQDVRLMEAGLNNAIDLLNLTRLEGPATRITVGAGNCPAIMLVRSNVVANDGYGVIPRGQLPSNFGTGEFSVSFVITQRGEGYILVIPSTTVVPQDGIGTPNDRQFGIWIRRNDVRFYYRISSDTRIQTAVIRTLSGPFFDVNNIETKHFTIVVNRNAVLVYENCMFAATAPLGGDILPANPDVDLFVGSGRPHPSTSGGRLDGDVHGLFYYEQALSADQITSFCSCGYEALELPSLPSDIAGTLETDNAISTITLTSSTPGAIIPAAEVSNILRSVNYTNQFDSPDRSTRELTFVVREVNDQEGTSIGSIALVVSDTSRPTVTLSSTSIDTSAVYVEDGPPSLISPQAQINRAAVVTPTFSRVVVTLTNPLDAEEVLTATGTEFISVLASNNQQMLEIVGPSVPVEFNAVLRSITYSNLNDNPNSAVQRRVTFVVYDTEGRTNEVVAVSTVNIQAVNDPPEISLASGASYLIDVVRFQEGTGGVLVAPNITVADVDSVNLQSATLTLTSPALSSDMLIIQSSLVNGVTINYNPSTGILNLNGQASLEDYQRLLSSVQFRSTDSPFLDSSVESLMRTVTVEVSDGQLNSITATVQVQFIPNNDAPIIMLTANVIFRDNDVQVLIAPTGNISDSDNRQLLSMTVELQDVLGNNVLSTGLQTGRVLQFGENSVADMVNLLRSISYVNMAPEPALNPRTITVMVCDFMLCNTSEITVEIVDVNDNPPLFSFPTYQFMIREDSGLGMTVGTLDVTDADRAATNFSFSTETQLFSLEPELTSVHILVNTTLDYEQTDSYEFNVTASDGVNSASAGVIVLVANVNERPSFRFIPLQPAIVVSSASQNRLIQVPFVIEDPDENDRTPIVTFSLMNVPVGSNESLTWNENAVPGYTFQSQETNGLLYVLSGPGDQASLTLALNEVMYVAGMQIVDPTTIRSVSIVLYDSSNATSEEARVTVSLASIPQFSERSYNLSLQEEEAVANFLQVQASVESGGNVIMYRIEQGRGITINASTGYLSLQQPLDREATPLVTFNVFAIDELPPARTGTATVRITVSDINDVRPTISGLDNITLSTGTPVMPLSSVTVEDPDTTGAIVNATFSVIGREPLVRSTFTGRSCVDESDLVVKMNSVCGGLTEGIVLLEQPLSGEYSLSTGMNTVLDLSGSDYVIVAASTASFAGTLSEFTFVTWVQAEGSGYIAYYGTPDSLERYFALYYNQMRNQLMVTLKREGVSGLSGQIRISFQLDMPLDDGAYHFVMFQYVSNSITCAVDGNQVTSLAVVYKEQPFIGEAFGELFKNNSNRC